MIHNSPEAGHTIAIRMIPVGDITPNDYNPNRMTAEQFAELVVEIKHLGRLPKPIVVRPMGDRYEIIDGEHGWRSAQECGLPEVPVEVIEADDLEAMRQTYKRNQHGTHDRVLQGQMFKAMAAKGGLSNCKLAELADVCEGTVRNSIIYADAADTRNALRGDDADSAIAELSIRQVRAYMRLGPTIRDLWLDAGASIKNLVDAADIRNIYDDKHTWSATDRLNRLEETGLLDFVTDRPTNGEGFSSAIKTVHEWQDIEYDYRHLPTETVRLYTRLWFSGELETGDLERSIGCLFDNILNDEGDDFLLTPEQVRECCKFVSCPIDLCDALRLAVCENHGYRDEPEESPNDLLRAKWFERKERLRAMEFEAKAPDFIKNSDHSIDAKEQLLDHFERHGDSDDLRAACESNEDFGFRRYQTVGHFIRQRVRQREVEEYNAQVTVEQLASEVAAGFHEDDDDAARMASVLVGLTKAELLVLREKFGESRLERAERSLAAACKTDPAEYSVVDPEDAA